MTDGALFVAGGVALAASYVALVLDYVETVKALDKGYTEYGPIAKLVVKKWGAKGLPLFTFLSASFVTVLAAVFGTLGADYLLAYTAPLFVGLAYNDIRNLIKAKK
jgi:hypothetical protein